MTPVLKGAAVAALSVSIAALAPAAARADGWKHYQYDDLGFAVQLPAEPVMSKGVMRLPGLPEAPDTVYAAGQDGVDFTATVADYSGTTVGGQAAIDAAVKAFAAEGQVKVDVTERIDRQFGRELNVTGRDQSQSAVAIFFVNHKLYQVVGRSLAPDPERTTGLASRFQQSLELTGLGAEANRPENRLAGGGPGFGGPGFGGPPGQGFGRGSGPGGGGPRRGPPPPQAFADCQGKSEGAAVRHTLPGGQVVDATCVATPQGLAARPTRLPPGEGPPPEG